MKKREFLQYGAGFAALISAGLITPAHAQARSAAGFDAKTLKDAIATLGGTPAASADIVIGAADIAENGAVVPVQVTSKIAGTTEIYMFVEKNPQPLAAGFVIPAGTEADVQTRVKMGQTSNVIAVVKANGKLFTASREVKVTLGGCGG